MATIYSVQCTDCGCFEEHRFEGDAEPQFNLFAPHTLRDASGRLQVIAACPLCGGRAAGEQREVE